LEAVLAGELDVEQDHRRSVSIDGQCRLIAIGRLSDDLETAGGEQRPCRTAKPCVVVDDQHGDGHLTILAGGHMPRIVAGTTVVSRNLARACSRCWPRCARTLALDTVSSPRKTRAASAEESRRDLPWT